MIYYPGFQQWLRAATRDFAGASASTPRAAPPAMLVLWFAGCIGAFVVLLASGFDGSALGSIFGPDEDSLLAAIADVGGEEALILKWLDCPAAVLDTLRLASASALQVCLVGLPITSLALPGLTDTACARRAAAGGVQARQRAFLIALGCRLNTSHYRSECFWLRIRGR